MWSEPKAGLFWGFFSPVSTLPIHYWQIQVSNANMSFWFWLTTYFDYSNTQEKENETDRFGELS